MHPDYTHLKREMVEYAEQNFYDTKEGQNYIRLYIREFDQELESIARDLGYVKDESKVDWLAQYDIPSPFPAITLPEGFKLMSLAEDNDIYKINRVMYRGFNHPGEPPTHGSGGAKRGLCCVCGSMV